MLRKAQPAGTSLNFCPAFIYGGSFTMIKLSQWMRKAQNLASQLLRGES